MSQFVNFGCKAAHCDWKNDPPKEDEQAATDAGNTSYATIFALF